MGIDNIEVLQMPDAENTPEPPRDEAAQVAADEAAAKAQNLASSLQDESTDVPVSTEPEPVEVTPGQPDPQPTEEFDVDKSFETEVDPEDVAPDADEDGDNDVDPELEKLQDDNPKEDQVDGPSEVTE